MKFTIFTILNRSSCTNITTLHLQISEITISSVRISGHPWEVKETTHKKIKLQNYCGFVLLVQSQELKIMVVLIEPWAILKYNNNQVFLNT